MRIDDFLSKLQKVQPDGHNKWKACCPAHDDKNPSMSVKLADDGKILMRCFAGCDFGDILQTMGLTARDVMGEDRREFAAAKARAAAKDGARERAKIIAYYDYTDENGKLVYQVCRRDDKSFTQRVPGPGGAGWKWGRSRYGVAATIYRLPQVLAAAALGKVVFVCEGEKDVETLEKHGFVATCNSGGAGKWEHGFSAHLKGCHGVFILADNDPGPEDVAPGKKYWQGQIHALLVQRSLNEAGINNTKALVLPAVDGRHVKDVTDWFEAGGTVDQFKAVIRSAPPLPPEKYLQNESFNPPKKTNSAQKKKLSEIIAIRLWEASKTDDGKSRRLSMSETRKIQNEVVFEWLKESGKFFYHLDYRSYLHNMYFDSSERELHMMQSDYFQSWLSMECGISRSDKSFADCINYLNDECLCGESTQGVIPEKYFCRRGDVVYVSNGDRHMVRVSSSGVDMIDNGSDGVVFSAGETLDEWILLSEDLRVNPIESCKIFASMPSRDDGAKLLLLLWILGVVYCHEKKPPLVAAGAVGSGKTRLCVGIFELFGMPIRVNQIGEKSSAHDDFWVSMNRHGLLCWDNVDTRIKWLPDALASASSNGQVEVRELYSNAGICFHRANANVMITSANPSFAGDAGLADRLLTLRLSRLIAETEDQELTEDIKRRRNAVLSWLCGVISKALADKNPVQKGLNRRHPQWSEFAVRCGRAINREAEAIAVIKSAELDKSLFAVENNWIGSILLDVLPDGREWRGTSQELVDYISEHGDLNERQQKNLSAKVVGNQLRMVWPHMEKVFGARKRTVTGRSEYILVGLVGYKGVNTESPQESACVDFCKINPPNPPNPPKQQVATEQKKIKETMVYDDDVEDLAGLGLDGWGD